MNVRKLQISSQVDKELQPQKGGSEETFKRKPNIEEIIMDDLKQIGEGFEVITVHTIFQFKFALVLKEGHLLT